MDQYTLNLLIVGASFAIYIGIALWARAGSTAEFYAANRGVNPVMNGMATAADWMSAASFISMAGLIAGVGYVNSTYLMAGRAATSSSRSCLRPISASSASTRFRSSSATASTARRLASSQSYA